MRDELSQRSVTAPEKRPAIPKGIRIVEAGQAPGKAGYRKAGKQSQASALVVECGHYGWRRDVFLCIVLDSSLVLFWYWIPGGAWGYFPILLVIAAQLTYSTLAELLNKTTLRIADGVLCVRHGPIPWRGIRELPSDRIWRLYVRKSRGFNSVTYDVFVEDEQETPIELISGLPSLAQAEFIAWVVEDHLGIEYDPDPAA